MKMNLKVKASIKKPHKKGLMFNPIQHYEWSINVMNKLFLSILYSIFQYFFDLHGMMPRDTR